MLLYSCCSRIHPQVQITSLLRAHSTARRMYILTVCNRNSSHSSHQRHTLLVQKSLNSRAWSLFNDFVIPYSILDRNICQCQCQCQCQAVKTKTIIRCPSDSRRGVVRCRPVELLSVLSFSPLLYASIGRVECLDDTIWILGWAAWGVHRNSCRERKS